MTAGPAESPGPTAARRRRVVVIGGGIVGLAVADRLLRDHPGDELVVVEKEPTWAAHQTGRNSGVIHSGLYYPPGSKKAEMCGAGRASMVAFAEQEGIPYAVCGKVVVATEPDELPRLAALGARGRANGLTVTELSAAGVRDHEPHVNALAGLHVAETGIIDYAAVCRALARRLEVAGVDLRLGTEVVSGQPRGDSVVLHLGRAGDPGGAPGAAGTTDRASDEVVTADLVVNCAGLHSDTVARRLGHRPGVQIVPFRGEYFNVEPPAADLVRGLVYPVPDPAFPFLGVHLTRGIEGHVHAGPNAVLALAREGYRWRTVRPRELAQTLSYPGLWHLARRHWRSGAAEMVRSASRRRFGDSLRRLVPEIRDGDLTPAPAGVRAQAVRPDGGLVDDFLIEHSGRCVHVLNAPSPAATSAFEIARHVAGLLPAS